jgi:hypothetical protein
VERWKNEQQGTVREEGLGLYTIGVSSVHSVFCRKRLGATGGALERRSALSAGV